MIKKLTLKNSTEAFIFTKEVTDIHQDFYITSDRKREFIKDEKLIYKLIKYKDFYAEFKDCIKGIMLIYKDKGFRTYLKILSKDKEVSKDLIKFFLWHYSDMDIYCKLKKGNPLVDILKRNYFEFIGDRGSEILLVHKKFTRKVGVKNGKDTDKTKRFNRR